MSPSFTTLPLPFIARLSRRARAGKAAMGATKLGAAALRRVKRQRQKARLKAQPKVQEATQTESAVGPAHSTEEEDEGGVEYVPETLDFEDDEFQRVAERFNPRPRGPTEEEQQVVLEQQNMDALREALERAEVEEGTAAEPRLSKKKLKKMCRMSLAALKRIARKPEVVEWEDVTAKDPEFLVFLKCYRNTVPVPKHWARKRKYLAGKRGFVKPPFELPPFIRDTGITEAREAARRQDNAKTLKVKAREKMRPKLGKLSVDYQRLHDAFFKYQTKPPLTVQGDLYYEGKEFESKYRDKRPGHLSDEARTALGMGSLGCPPWLYNMQRHGPPPSYQHLKIPGLNAPIPEGAQWGYHAGGWGKPPVDDATKPLFEGVAYDTRDPKTRDAYLRPVEHNLWGEFEPEDDDDEAVEEDGTVEQAD